jgi:hypothetical protein
MKYFIIFLILIGFSGTAFAQYMGNISNQTLEYTSPIIRLTDENIILPPLKQIKSGISIDKIQCRDNLQLILKTSDNSPACVKPETKTKLIERGWGEHTPIPEPEIIKKTDFDSEKYYEEFDSGSPLMYLDTSNPVLDNDNCERYAYWLTKHQKEKLDRYEDYPRYPPWGNQIFPLVDYCIKNGDLIKTIVNDKIQWSFSGNSEPEPDDTLSESNYDPSQVRCSSGVIPYIPKDWQTTGKHPSDETWETLDRHLMSQFFFKELQERNIVFKPACFGVYTGFADAIYPPRYSMCSMVTASNGTNIYLEGTIREFDVDSFYIDDKIPYQCDDEHHGCLCGLENEN